MYVRIKTGRLGIGIFINVPEWSDLSSHSLVFFIRHQQFISEGGRGAWDFLCLSVENPIFFQASGRSKIC